MLPHALLSASLSTRACVTAPSVPCTASGPARDAREFAADPSMKARLVVRRTSGEMAVALQHSREHHGSARPLSSCRIRRCHPSALCPPGPQSPAAPRVEGGGRATIHSGAAAAAGDQQEGWTGCGVARQSARTWDGSCMCCCRRAPTVPSSPRLAAPPRGPSPKLAPLLWGPPPSYPGTGPW